MDFIVLINDFFSDMSVPDLLAKYSITHKRLVGIINSYLIQYKLKASPYIINKLRIPVEEIYMDLMQRNTTDTLVIEKYKLSPISYRNLINKYCEENNLIKPTLDTVLDQNMEEIYRERLSGKTYSFFAQKYKCSISTVEKFVIKYCDKNKLAFPKRILPGNEILAKYESGFTYKKIASEYKCSPPLIKRKLLEEYKKRLLIDLKFVLLNSNQNTEDKEIDKKY